MTTPYSDILGKKMITRAVSILVVFLLTATSQHTCTSENIPWETLFHNPDNAKELFANQLDFIAEVIDTMIAQSKTVTLLPADDATIKPFVCSATLNKHFLKSSEGEYVFGEKPVKFFLNDPKKPWTTPCMASFTGKKYHYIVIDADTCTSIWGERCGIPSLFRVPLLDTVGMIKKASFQKMLLSILFFTTKTLQDYATHISENMGDIDESPVSLNGVKYLPTAPCLKNLLYELECHTIENLPDGDLSAYQERNQRECVFLQQKHSCIENTQECQISNLCLEEMRMRKDRTASGSIFAYFRT